MALFSAEGDFVVLGTTKLGHDFWVFSGGRGREQVPREIFPPFVGLPAAEFDLTWPPMARIYGSSYSTSTCEVRRLAD